MFNLKGQSFYSHNFNKLNKRNILWAKISSLEIVEYPLHQLICLGHLHVEIHTTLLNSNIDVRILAQGCCVAIISLSLLVFELDIERDEIRKAF